MKIQNSTVFRLVVLPNTAVEIAYGSRELTKPEATLNEPKGK